MPLTLQITALQGYNWRAMCSILRRIPKFKAIWTTSAPSAPNSCGFSARSFQQNHTFTVVSAGFERVLSSTMSSAKEGSQEPSIKAAKMEKGNDVSAKTEGTSFAGVYADIVSEDTRQQVQFLTDAGLGKQVFSWEDEDGKVGHSCVKISDAMITFADTGSKFEDSQPSPYMRLGLCVENAIEFRDKLVKGGCEEVLKVQPQFWGFTYGLVRDPFGVTWALCSKGGSAPPKPKSLENANKVVPHLSMDDAQSYIDFLKKAFNARDERPPALSPEGKVLYASVLLNDGGVVSLSSKMNMPGESEKGAVGYQVNICVGNAVEVGKKMVAAGGKEVMEVQKQFWGDVYGELVDPQGFRWGIMENRLAPKEEREASVKVCSKYDWEFSFEKKENLPLKVLGETRTVEKSKISEFVMEALPRIFKAIEEKDLPVTGTTVAMYHEWSEDKKEVKMTVGSFVDEKKSKSKDPPPIEGLDLFEFSPRTCTYAKYEGPYTKLPMLWEAAVEWSCEVGTPTTPCLEVYARSSTDPHNKPDDNVTEIYCTLEKKGGNSGLPQDYAECK